MTKRYFTVTLLSLFLSCSSEKTKSMFQLTSADFKKHSSKSVGAARIQDRDWELTSVTLQKGEVVLYEASGEVTSSGTTAGPEGDAAIGGSTYLLTNRAVLGLYGKVGSSVFLIGSSSALLAPEDGELSIAVNTCSGCSVSGSFDVTVHTELNDGVEIASEPELSDNSVSDTVQATVNASQQWTATSLSLSKGEKIFVDASGTVSAGSSYGPNGDAALGGASYFLTNRRIFRLYGRVNQSVVELGASSVFLSPATGTLELAANTPSGATGSYSVTLQRGVLPAVGLDKTALASLGQSKSIQVTPDAQWKGTSLTVTKGDPLVFEASGTLSNSADADGLGPIGGGSYPLVNRPVDALHGKVGDQVFYVGGSNVILAPASGSLELIINTPSGSLSGQFDVAVRAP